LLPAVLLAGFLCDITHDADDDMVASVIQDCLDDMTVVFREIGAPVIDIAAFLPDFEERGWIQDAHHLVAEDVLRTSQVHQPAGGRVDLLHLEVLVQHNDGVGCVLDDIVGKGLRLVLEKRQAHAEVRFACQDSRRFVPAGVIAAAAAVHLLIRPRFAHVLQNVGDRLFSKLDLPDGE